MALFPELGPQYYDEKDKPILARMENFYSQAITYNLSFWGEADIDTRFEAGDQSVWNDMYGNLSPLRRRQFNFNRIRRIVNMVSGYQRRNRMSTIVSPIENADEITADQFTKILFWIHQSDSTLETLSQAFHGALVTGLNLLQVWVDYRRDPISGDIRVDNCAYNSFLIDPFFRKPDLSDCNTIWKRSFLTRQEILSLVPDKTEEILALPAQGERDGKFQFMPENYNFSVQNLMTYDEFYYRDYRHQKMLVDTQTGETTEWASDDKEALQRFLNQYQQITVLDNQIPTVKLAIVVQGKVIYDGPNPIGIDEYPFVPVLGYYNPQMPYYPWRIQGMVRGLRDSQYLYNRRKVIELDILESQVNSGWVYKENALVNPKDVWEQIGQGRGIALKEEASIADIQRIEAPQVPPSMIELSKILADEIMQISGVNEELLGSAIDDKAGVLAMLRQGAGLTTLQSLFDQLDVSQKLLGRKMISIIQNNFAPGKVARILNQDPSPQFYNKLFGRYDAAIEEGVNTTTQRQMQFAQLIQLKATGLPIPDDVILQAATLQNKQELINAVKQTAQAQAQAQQAQAQAQNQLVQAQVEMAHGQALASQGTAMERASRVDENKALADERHAQAVKDQFAGVLDLAKAIKELEGIDISNIRKVIEIAQLLKAETQTSTPTPQAVPSPIMAGVDRDVNLAGQAPAVST